MPPPPDRYETIRDCRAQYLKLLGALLRRNDQLSAAAIHSIQHGAAAYFDEMVESRGRGSFKEEVQGLTSSRITLVGEDDLELGIRLDNLSAKLFEATGSDLWKVQLRFVTLLKRPDLARSSIPVGPKGICQGLDEMFIAAGAIGIDKKLQQLDRIETTLQEDLPALYAELNSFLDRAGIETAQPAIVSSQEPPRRPTPEAPAVSANALLALQQALLSQLPGLPQNLPQAGGGSAASLLSQAAIERLTFRLNELERQGGFAAPSLRAGSSPSLETLIPGLFSDSDTSGSRQPKSLNSGELGIQAGAPEGIAIDTLAMIFEAIFANPKLPDTLKAVISSLQITMLKLTMQDPGLFTDTAHPARLLLDRMAVAMLGLPIDVAARHPVCARLFEIAGQLRSQYSGQIAAVSEALTQVDALIAERNASIVSAAQAYIPLLNQLDRRDQADLQSRQAIEQWIERGSVPDSIREFLDNIWRRVLQMVWLENGPNSTQWQEHTTAIDDLLWTFQPKSGEDRKALARRLPEILRQLKGGMERLGTAPEIQAAFLDDCFALQTRAMRTAPVAGKDAETPPLLASVPRPTAGEPVAGEIESGPLLLRTLDFSCSRPAPARPLPCQPGDWLEIQLDGNETGVALLCHISPRSQRALLCNPDGKLAVAIHPAILDKQLRDGLARISSSTSLFDMAANHALRRTTAP